MPDSITVCGIGDANYARKFAAKLATTRFAPALRDGQRVVAAAIIHYDFLGGSPTKSP